ncbi:MAG: glutathione synthase [Gammaproteobacteria bacterium RIFCSPHIGHO2_12_FULL_35_23]|nr:MAG: glutathione synthase [Gammaproteobacteria bacterium RIFCSPHIGHO2_12_FULL_35_23]
MKLGIIMDPIATIKPKKDTGFAMLLEAQRRGWQLYYMEPRDLFFKNNTACTLTKLLTVQDNNHSWFKFNKEQTINLAELDIILMRQDPPFNLNYIYTTYLLEHAEQAGTLVINKPQSLRDANEKVFATWFPDCIPPLLISSQLQLLKDFITEQQDVILKPLNGLGGQGIFRIDSKDPNSTVTIELLTNHFTTPIMAQRYLPEIKAGDKRILLINGNPVSHALVRIAQPGETRANLAAGGKAETQPLTQRDYWLCEQVAPVLKEKGLLFVGLDVIGDYITEINVTSPTCVRELDTLCGLNICQQLFDEIESLLIKKRG